MKRTYDSVMNKWGVGWATNLEEALFMCDTALIKANRQLGQAKRQKYIVGSYEGACAEMDRKEREKKAHLNKKEGK